jgi:hypothetical protein
MADQEQQKRESLTGLYGAALKNVTKLLPY